MKIFGFNVNVGRVVAKLVTYRVVVRYGKKLVLLAGTSAGEGVKRKFFVRTELFDGVRFSAGKIREGVRA